MSFKIVKINSSNEDFFKDKVLELNKLIHYPFAERTFQMSYSESYFDYFKKLGEVHYYLMIDNSNSQVVATGAAILRTLSWNEFHQESVWFLTDLKVHPDYRGRKLSLKLIAYGFFRKIWSCRKAYMISYDPKGGLTRNSAVSLLTRFRWAPIRYAITMYVYHMTFSEFLSHQTDLRKTFGDLVATSTDEYRTLRLNSSSNTYDFVHLQRGALALSFDVKPITKSSVICFLLEEHESLRSVLKTKNVLPVATASVLTLNFRPLNWSFLLTSDV